MCRGSGQAPDGESLGAREGIPAGRPPMWCTRARRTAICRGEVPARQSFVATRVQISAVDVGIFGVLSMFVAIVSAIKVFTWAATLYGGSSSLDAPRCTCWSSCSSDATRSGWRCSPLSWCSRGSLAPSSPSPAGERAYLPEYQLLHVLPTVGLWALRVETQAHTARVGMWAYGSPAGYRRSPAPASAVCGSSAFACGPWRCPGKLGQVARATPPCRSPRHGSRSGKRRGIRTGLIPARARRLPEGSVAIVDR